VLRTALPRCKTQLSARANMCFVWASCFPSHDLQGLLSFTWARFWILRPSKYNELWQRRRFMFGQLLHISVFKLEKLFRSTAYLQTCSQKLQQNLVFTMSEVQLCQKNLA
jgi:hypothetical protein